MDDVLTGADSEQEAIALQTELRLLCKAGGFNLRKWASNKPALMAQVPSEDAVPECKWQAGETHTALGVHWSLSDDCFRAVVQPTTPGSNITRRLVLYLEWDSPLPQSEADYWMRFLADLPALNRITIPRWLGLQPTSQQRELHGFADASERAYAAAIYLRVLEPDGTIHTQLITARA